MKNNILAKLVVLMMLVAFTAPSPATAGFLSDWIDQQSATSAGSFQGQKRGYFHGGSYSARWKQSGTTFPVSVQMPKFKGGCGGIDMFFGGMSFMDFDMLVQKLQGILMNAAAIAFDMALATLCEQCSTILGKFEDLANKLNNMSMDECQAAEGIMATFKNDETGGFKSLKDSMGAIGSKISSIDIKQGATDMWNDFMETKKVDDTVSSTDKDKMFDGCDQTVKDTIFKPGSLLANLGSKIGIDDDYIAQVRAEIGDIHINSKADLYRADRKAPCKESSDGDTKAPESGQMFIMDDSYACSQVPATEGISTEWVMNKMNSIATAIRTQGDLGPGDEEFMLNSPIAIYPVLKLAVGTQSEASIIGSMASFTAKAYALQFLVDIYSGVNQFIYTGKEITAKGGSATSIPGAPEKCMIEEFTTNVNSGLSDMQRLATDLSVKARASFETAASELKVTYDILAHLGDSDEKLKTKMKEALKSIKSD